MKDDDFKNKVFSIIYFNGHRASVYCPAEYIPVHITPPKDAPRHVSPSCFSIDTPLHMSSLERMELGGIVRGKSVSCSFGNPSGNNY